MSAGAIKRYFREISELIAYHDLALARESSGWARRLGRVLVYFALPAAIALTPFLPRRGIFTALLPPSFLFPSVLSVALLGAALALAAWLTVPRSSPSAVAPEGPGEEHFFTTTGWTPLQKYTAWLVASFKPWLQIWAILGAEVLLYHILASSFTGLNIGTLSPQYGFLPMPGLSGAVLLVSSWLVLLIYLFSFHLLRAALDLYLESSRQRLFLTLLITLLVLVTGGAYFLGGLGGMERTLTTLAMTEQSVLTNSPEVSLPYGLWPELAILTGAAVLLMWQHKLGYLRAWLVKPAIWLLPIWSAVAVVAFIALNLGGADTMLTSGMQGLPQSYTFGMTEPWIISALVLILTNPVEAMAILMIDNGPMLLHGKSPTLSEPFGDLLTATPELWFHLEACFIANALVWTAALFLHGYFGFYNRVYGRPVWDAIR